MVCTEQLFAVSARAAQTHLRESLSAKSDPLQTAIMLDFAHCLCVWNPRMRSTLSSWQRSINCQLGDPRQRILPPSLAHSLHRLSVAFASSALRFLQVNTTIYAQPNRTILNWTELQISWLPCTRLSCVLRSVRCGCVTSWIPVIYLTQVKSIFNKFKTYNLLKWG